MCYFCAVPLLVMPSAVTDSSYLVAWIAAAMPSQFCWPGWAEIMPLSVLPANILTVGVGSSLVAVLAERYAAHPDSHAMTVLPAVEAVSVLTTLSLVVVLAVRIC